MKKGLPQSMRTCLVYITHKMDDAIYRYLSYLLKETEGVMDMLVLYDQAFQPIIPTDFPAIRFVFFNSRDLRNFFHQGDRLLPNPLVALFECASHDPYEQYLLMENDIVLNGSFREFVQKIAEKGTADYIHIATDMLGSPQEHWPIKYIKDNPWEDVRFSWCQLFCVIHRFLMDLDTFMKQNDSIYYEFLLPTMVYNGHYVVKQFENYGYQFQVSWGPAEKYETMYLHCRTEKTFYHPIKKMEIVNIE